MTASTDPLVSIICTCFNHLHFFREALDSVLNQTYNHIELVVIDDHSQDGSAEAMANFLKDCPEVTYFRNSSNQGICKNFNQGLANSRGKYVIDLSADDILVYDRIEKQVRLFEELGSEYGVIFSNARYIDVKGNLSDYHYPVNHSGKALNPPSEGNLYPQLIQNYFVAAPTMMMKRSLLEQMGGYDEALAYEDFDFWIRSSRQWKYKYQDESLTMIRRTPDSLGTKYYGRNDKQLLSTYQVCQKIRALNQTAEEDKALVRRLKYEIKHAVLAEKREEAELFLSLLSELQPLTARDRFLKSLNSTGIKSAWLRDKIVKLNSR